MTITRAAMPVTGEAETTRHWPPRSSRYVAGDTRPVLRVDVLVQGEACWASNEVRFLDQMEARTFALGLRTRWIVIEQTRVVPEAWPRHELYQAAGHDGPGVPSAESLRWPEPRQVADQVDPGVSGAASGDRGGGG
jgi:hypothetical protein